MALGHRPTTLLNPGQAPQKLGVPNRPPQPCWGTPEGFSHFQGTGGGGCWGQCSSSVGRGLLQPALCGAWVWSAWVLHGPAFSGFVLTHGEFKL